MFKKLLYLYNDGHNPFPQLKHGQGGLGYHLPQYKLMGGKGFDLETLEFVPERNPETGKRDFTKKEAQRKNEMITHDIQDFMKKYNESLKDTTDYSNIPNFEFIETPENEAKNEEEYERVKEQMKREASGKKPKKKYEIKLPTEEEIHESERKFDESIKYAKGISESNYPSLITVFKKENPSVGAINVLIKDINDGKSSVLKKSMEIYKQLKTSNIANIKDEISTFYWENMDNILPIKMDELGLKAGDTFEEVFVENCSPILQKSANDYSDIVLAKNNKIFDIKNKQTGQPITVILQGKKRPICDVAVFDADSKKHVYEIKYKVNESIGHGFILLQTTKIYGNGSFIPLYSKQGNVWKLYTIFYKGTDECLDIGKNKDVEVDFYLKEGLFKYEITKDIYDPKTNPKGGLNAIIFDTTHPKRDVQGKLIWKNNRPKTYKQQYLDKNGNPLFRLWDSSYSVGKDYANADCFKIPSSKLDFII